jgi:hypothetical protein
LKIVNYANIGGKSGSHLWNDKNLYSPWLHPSSTPIILTSCELGDCKNVPIVLTAWKCGLAWFGKSHWKDLSFPTK